MSRRRVVVTGLGIICPVGNTVPEAWADILAGQSGITRITRFDASAFPCQIAGEVKGFDVAEYLSAQGSAPLRTPSSTTAWRRRIQALKDSGLEVTPENAERIGVNIGSGIGGLPLIEGTHRPTTSRAGRARSRRSSFPAASST